MTRASRYVRPATPEGLQLTKRDHAVLRSLLEHRYLTSDHIQALHFRSVSRTVVQVRLRKLWQNHFTDRMYLPVVLDGTRRCLINAARPLYCLARLGAEVVAQDCGVTIEDVPHTPRANAAGFATLTHNLVATDFLVAVQAATAAHMDVQLVAGEREQVLRAKAMAWAQTRGLRAQYIVPDAAVTLHFRASGATRTFYLEVVRADVKRGNQTLYEKLRKYGSLLRSGFFRDVYGHGSIRAVLIATTTLARAENFRRMAAELAHARNLFWFGSYERTPTSGIPVTHFTPEQVLTPHWRDVDGAMHALLPRAPALETS